MNTYTQEIKNDWTKRGELHQSQDDFIRGQWLSRDEKNEQGEFKGCFFGCMTQVQDNTLQTASEQMGVPIWLIQLAEQIFENLPAGEGKLFPLQFIKSLPIDMTRDEYRYLYHRTSVLRLRGLPRHNLVNKTIDTIIKLHENYLTTNDDDWSAAESAARSVAESAELVWSVARSAAESVTWSAAESAAESVTWLAAWSAAWSAESAAESAARSVVESAWSVVESAWSVTRSAESVTRSAESAELVWSVARSAAESAESAARSAESAARSVAWINERDSLFDIFKYVEDQR